MSHTHIYDRYIPQANATLLKGTGAVCPLGHANCLINSTGSTSVLAFTDELPEMAPGSDTLHHTHTYYKMTVLSTASVDYVAGGGGSTCATTVFSGGTKSNYPTSVVEVEAETSDAIWDTETTHHHTYLFCNYFFINAWATGLTTCASGHNNCKRISVASVPYTTPDNTDLGEVEGVCTGYWWYFDTSVVDTPLPSVETLPAGWTAEVETKTPPAYIDRTWALIRGELISLEAANNGVYLGFDYGKTTDYGHVQWYNPPLGATKVYLPQLFSANIGGLQVGTTYHYRAKAQLKGNIYTALLNGSVTLVGEYEGFETECYFEWGEDTDYGYETEHKTLYYSSTFSSVVLLANEADPEGTFHCRAVARNAFGTIYGEDVEFTALGAFYGADESFETLAGLPPPVFGAGAGYDYITAKQALEHVSKVAVGRGYGDSEGKFNYESRNVR
jgi:hypothetical protein